MKKRFWIILLLAGLTFCLLGGYIGYGMSQSRIEKDLAHLNQRIDDLFDGNDVIQDGQAEMILGEDSQTGYTLHSGGFTIYRLSKESDGFVKSRLNADNIKWLKGKYEYYNYGFKMPTNRPEPQEVYNNGFNFLLHGTDRNPSNIYKPQTLTEIKGFPGTFSAEYHEISSTEHPTEFYTETTTNWYLTTETYQMSYNDTKEYYKVITDETKCKSVALRMSLLGCAIGLIPTLLLSLLLRLVIPKTGQGESIFKKKWKNIENNSIFMIEPKLFGKNLVTIIENEKTRKGIAKITERGRSIHFSFSDSEIFFQLKHLSSNKLEMENLATNMVVKFELLGSNAYGQSEQIQQTSKGEIDAFLNGAL